MSDPGKDALIETLQRLQEAVLAKAEGLSEYDLRRPLTATGSNILGIIKHLAAVQAGYFGDCFGRPWPEQIPAFAPGAGVNDDMWATAQESSTEILQPYRRTWEHALGTFAERELGDTGEVAWWPAERRHPTLAAVMIHMSVETARHAGHLDILRELIDRRAGRWPGDPSLPSAEEIDWAEYVARLEAVARAAP